MNLRPSGYEPDELPCCSTPRQGKWTIRALAELVKFVRKIKAIGLHCLINFVCAIWLFCPAGYLKAMSWRSQGCASAKLKRKLQRS